MYDVRRKIKIDQRARAISEANALYYPFERLPEVRLQYYAYACLETALVQSEDVRNIFELVVNSWGLPGCQPIIDEFAKHSPETRTYFGDIAKAAKNNQPMPESPRAAIEAILKYQDEDDFRRVLDYHAYLIVFGFNRKIDLENRTPKVWPSEAPYLVRAISFYSLMEHLQANPRKDKNPDHIELGKQVAEFYQVSSANPTNREGRRLRHEVVSAARSNGFILCHNTKMLKDAEQWYKCRVNPGTIEAYLDEVAKADKYLERSNIETTIAPCDEATGYPRKWRK